MMVQNLKVG
jgi:hypothetical protein